ncbi:hypothetical protein FIBSPDRAFT_1044706 [Athelia psychrophila]|uniref:Uncharacterized protein n=1 Tax=Athelia psychrophila TaxID=1759441 RepID=A0A166JAM4_9AGAM|nr:hypothetical protein FIBSPDRAFT_1044706 [Fibularhizoctonia sp. CBS 109695]
MKRDISGSQKGFGKRSQPCSDLHWSGSWTTSSPGTSCKLSFLPRRRTYKTRSFVGSTRPRHFCLRNFTVPEHFSSQFPLLGFLNCHGHNGGWSVHNPMRSVTTRWRRSYRRSQLSRVVNRPYASTGIHIESQKGRLSMHMTPLRIRSRLLSFSPIPIECDFFEYSQSPHSYGTPMSRLTKRYSRICFTTRQQLLVTGCGRFRPDFMHPNKDRCVRTRYPGSLFGKVKRFFIGQGLQAVSKALLLTGQLYYGVTIGALVVAVSAQYIGYQYSDAIGAFYIALSSALACRVFRMLLLCRSGTEDTAISTRAVESMIMAEMAGLGPEVRGAAGASEVDGVYQSGERDP